MQAADVIVLAIGEKTTDNDREGNTGGEGRDRPTIGLPGMQARRAGLCGLQSRQYRDLG